jgi:outer membrane protein, multidrug efflux system
VIVLLLIAQALPPVQAVQPPPQSSLKAPLPPLTADAAPEGLVLTLPAALDAALGQSPDLAIVLERVRQAENNVGRAWSTLRPTLTATGTVTYNNEPGTVFTLVRGAAGTQPTFEVREGSNWSRQGTVQFAWDVLNFRAFPALATARQQVEVSRLTEMQQRRELLLSVASTYYSGVSLRELAQVALAQARATRNHALEAQARYEAGLIHLSAALRARIDYLRAEQVTKRARFSYAAAKSQLAALLDRRDTSFELAPPPQPPAEIRGTFKELVERALLDRPEMAAARVNEEIAARLKTDAWAQFAPSLAVTGASRYNDPPISSTGGKATWAVAVSLTLPLYDGGFRYVALKDADSQVRQARAQARSQGARIEDELRRAMLELDSARALREETEQALIVSRENERLIRAQFAAGSASQVEVSDAESALFESESLALQQRLAVQLAGLRLAKAVGAFDIGGGAK